MENSGKILFGEDASQWYVAVGQKWIGPMSASDIYEKVASHELTLAHFAWKKGQTDWKRICDIKTFQSLGPHEPQKAAQKQFQSEVSAQTVASRSEGMASGKSAGPSVRPAAAGRRPAGPAAFLSSCETRTWYLNQNQAQLGPFSTEEITRFLKTGKINGRVHAWRDGMKNWDRLEQVPEFRALAASALLARPAAAQGSKIGHGGDKIQENEQRYHPRRPLVAKILMSDQETVIVGVCRDISIGGLQVLTETVPGAIGTKIKMNISPSSNEAGEPIESFVAEGVIVRILEDGRGFSFRFNRLADRARQAIESYIESPV